MFRCRGIAAFIATIVVAVPARSADSVATGRVTQIATTQLYAQGAVIFQLSASAAPCPAGNWIYYHSSGDDLKTVYATVLAAYFAGTPVWAHFPVSGSCEADGISVVPF